MDLIERQAAIDVMAELQGRASTKAELKGISKAWKRIKKLPSAQPEKTEYIPDTKAVPSTRDCVDLHERVTATYYDEQYEEWTQKTVTIADVLDSVCDVYTILPSVKPDIIRCKDCKHRPVTNDNYDDDEWDCGFNIEFPDYKCPCRCEDGYYNRLPDDNWFCGNAERRSDG